MPSYPLAFPSVVPASAVFMMESAVSSSVSPFTYNQQVYKHQGERWRGSVQWPPLTRDQAAAVTAFMLELQGQFGTFLYGDPNYLAQGPRGIATGSGQVDGAAQTGNSLNVKALTVGVSGLLKKGDYFQIGTGLSARLYQLTQDVDSASDGTAIFHFFPALRSSPADNAAIVINGARGLFRAAGNVAEWAVSVEQLYGVNFSFVEAIGE